MSHQSEVVVKHSNVINLSHGDLSNPAEFKEFQKKVKENVHNLVFLLLRETALKPEYSTPLFTSLKRAAHLDALDLSSNMLHAPFEHVLTDYLKVLFVLSLYPFHFLILYLVLLFMYEPPSLFLIIICSTARRHLSIYYFKTILKTVFHHCSVVLISRGNQTLKQKVRNLMVLEHITLGRLQHF